MGKETTLAILSSLPQQVFAPGKQQTPKQIVLQDAATAVR